MVPLLLGVAHPAYDAASKHPRRNSIAGVYCNQAKRKRKERKASWRGRRDGADGRAVVQKIEWEQRTCTSSQHHSRHTAHYSARSPQEATTQTLRRPNKQSIIAPAAGRESGILRKLDFHWTGACKLTSEHRHIGFHFTSAARFALQWYEGRWFNPGPAAAAWQSVLEQDTEPATAPASLDHDKIIRYS